MPNQEDRRAGSPFSTYDRNFQQQDAGTAFGASPIAGAADMQKRQDISMQTPASVALPLNLYPPVDSQTVDISALANIPPGTTQDLLVFTGQKGSITRFIGYSIFNDALMLALITLVPTVNGVRVFPLHGNPQLKFKMGLGLGPDMATLVLATLDLQPGDVLRWTFTNNDVVDVAAGVRMSGYLDQSTIRPSARFGG